MYCFNIRAVHQFTQFIFDLAIMCCGLFYLGIYYMILFQSDLLILLDPMVFTLDNQPYSVPEAFVTKLARDIKTFTFNDLPL